MSLSQVRNCNMGPFKGFLTGTSGVGYTLLNSDGSTEQFRTTVGVSEQFPGCGIYAASISFPDQFNGTILWDTGETIPKFASEQYNTEENNPIVNKNNQLLQQLTGSSDFITGSMGTLLTNIEFLVDMEGGRWSINPTTKKMTFYKDDNVTPIATFYLFDVNGNPSVDQVSTRYRDDS